MSEHDEHEDYVEPGRSIESRVETPGVLLWVCGWTIAAVSLVVFLSSSTMLLDFVLKGRERSDDDWRIAAALSFLGVGWGAVILVGSVRMSQFRNYRLAILASIMAAIPGPCIFLGIVSLPIGAWALMVLLQSDVRARFKAVARGTIPENPRETGDARIDRTI